MINLSKSVRDVLVYLRVDWVPLASVISSTRARSPEAPDRQGREMVLKAVLFMLTAGLVKEGDLEPDGAKLHNWEGNIDELMARIEATWLSGTDSLLAGVRGGSAFGRGLFNVAETAFTRSLQLRAAISEGYNLYRAYQTLDSLGMFSSSEGVPHTCPAKDLTKINDDEERLISKREPVHDVKGENSRWDLFKDKKGNIYKARKGGRGEAETVDRNINDYY